MKAWRHMHAGEQKARYAELANARLEEKRRAELSPRPHHQVAQTHAEREAYWLAQERALYGPVKRAKPLSQMPA